MVRKVSGRLLKVTGRGQVTDPYKTTFYWFYSKLEAKNF